MSRFRFYLIVLVCVIISAQTIRSIVDLRQADSRVKETRDRLAKASSENKKLLAQNQTVQSPEFVEQMARDKLGMSKPGETVVILPENLGSSPKVATVQEEENWRKWLRLIMLP